MLFPKIPSSLTKTTGMMENWYSQKLGKGIHHSFFCYKNRISMIKMAQDCWLVVEATNT
jgi:hypothetical protein